ncbi:alpha/beta hydrolase [Cellulophaga sp. Hel_I_12]|uniref:alpha/beta hydrolase n=1 Tax=Cellulophaga sp. Hel_I_12 TaxID=1249972 RepID=UPI000645D132|nr:alpha/beta hydrolase [Cellulophaga sp. Hel_I_12]
MKNTILLFALLVATFSANSQTIYSKAYGNSNDKPLIYLHGGPGFNAAGFEVTTAQKLAENGFYVIAYDRRGEGRSLEKNAAFTFNETFEDLNLIYDTFNITSATLVGHSFGGIIATLYAEKYPNKVKAVVLVSAPLSTQESFSTVLNSSKAIYFSKKDTVNLNYIKILENMDKSTLEYSSYCFGHAMQNGFYYPKAPTKEAVDIYSRFKTDTLLVQYGSQMTYEAPQGFWRNEKYTTLDIKENLRTVLKNSTPIFGLYGKDDGLFSEVQITEIGSLIGKEKLEYMENCSHNLFIDQQTKFINALKNWIK